MITLIIQPTESLIEEIIPHLKNKGKDYSGNLVVFPGKRPSHFLRKAIAKKVKGSFIPPVILSMDEFVDLIYQRLEISGHPHPNPPPSRGRGQTDDSIPSYVEVPSDSYSTSGEVSSDSCSTSGEVSSDSCSTSGEVSSDSCSTSGEVSSDSCSTSGVDLFHSYSTRGEASFNSPSTGGRGLGGGGRKIQTIDAIAVLYDIHKKAVNPVGGDGFQSPDSFLPLGLNIYRDLEELYIEAVKPLRVKDIEAYTTETIPEYSLKGLQSLSFFYERFYKTVQETGLSTRSVRYRAVADRLDEAEPDNYGQIIFAGFYALTQCEKVLFRKLLGKENAIFIFQEGPGLEEKLSEIGITPKNPPSPPLSKEGIVPYRLNTPLWKRGVRGDYLPDIHFYSSPDTHGQVYALGRLMEKRTGNTGTDEKCAIVLPNAETLFPLLRQGVSFIDEDNYNISLGYPLHRTPLFGFLNNLMELHVTRDNERVYLPDYLKFVLHPYTKNIYYKGSAEITRIMFHAIEETLYGSEAGAFIPLREIEENDALPEDLLKRTPFQEAGVTKTKLRKHIKTIHENTIERFTTFKDIRDFAQKCSGIITYIYNNSTARLHPLFHPFSESLLRELGALEESMLNSFSFREPASYFTFFRKYIMSAYSPFEGAPLKGLQILGFLETRNIKFDEVYILDANEETLPDTRKDTTLLPFRARQILGLPTYMDRDRLSAYYFETLLRGASKAHLFFIENNKKEKSRFVEKLLWEKQKEEKATETKNYITPVQYRINLDNPVPEEIPKTDRVAEQLKYFEYSATALDVYLGCQLQFFYTYVLGLEKREKVSGDIERSDIGKFVHTVLAGYFRNKTGKHLSKSDLDVKEMLDVTDRLFEEKYGSNPSGALYLLKLQLRDHLRDVLEKYYTPLAVSEHVSILGSEEKISMSEGSFRLKGYIDSIQKRDKRICIIDYKTGATSTRLKINFKKLDPGNRETWDKAIGSIQLPFYLLLYSRKTGLNAEDMNAMFLMLGHTWINRDIEVPLFEHGEEGHKYAMLEDIIIRLLHEIIDPHIPFKPATDKKSSCPICDYKHICGTQWVVK